MENIYQTASDKYVGGSYVYVKSSEAYYDSAFTKKIVTADLVNAFNMGTAIIVDGEVSYKPVSMSVTSNVATLTYVKADSTTAVLATVKSTAPEA